MPATPAIIFDVGNVLLDWQPERIYRAAFPDDAERADFVARVVPLDWHHEQDLGRPIAEGTAARIALFPEHEAHIRAFYERWLETIEGVISGSVAILQDVRAQGYPVHTITNFSAELWRRTVDAYPFLADFEVAVVSGEEGVTKPDAEIFHRFLSRAKVAAEDCIFIDDCARAAGAERGSFHAPLVADFEL